MEILAQQFIRAFGWSILSSLWQSAIIYGVLFILMYSLPKLASKHRHNLAFSAIVAMFIAFAYNFINQIVLTMPKEIVSINSKNLLVYQYFSNIDLSFSNKADQYFPIVVTFYVIGIVLQLFVIVKGYNQLSTIKNKGLTDIPDSWKVIFDKVTAELKLNKTIKFQISNIVNVPLVIGYLKPVVLFPIALLNQLDNEQVEAILIHELSHIRRNDFLLNLIKTAIETLLFYNPFVWLAGRFIHIEREHACDDLVLKITGEPLHYAHALLKLELIKDKNSPSFAMAVTGKTQNLYQRIKRITNMKTNYLNTKQQMAALTLGIACLFSIAWINPSSKNQIKKSLSLGNKNIIDTAKSLYTLDTTKGKKIQIIMKDKSGKKVVYNSYNEIPDSLKNEIKNKIVFLNDSSNVIYADMASLSPEMQQQIESSRLKAEEIRKQFDSPEWKKQQADIVAQSEKIRKQFDSPEWKKQQADIVAQSKKIKKQFESPEWKKQQADIVAQSEKIKKQFDSPEWKKQQADIVKQGEATRKYFESPEWKEKIKEQEKLQNSIEYKELKQKFDKDVQELKDKKN